MATIKSYTDIEQSKKLAEFLSPESADLKWFFWKEESIAAKSPSFGFNKETAEFYKETNAVYLPCWSLSALLSVLPKPKIYYSTDKTKRWYCECWDKMGNYIGYTKEDNPIDSCVNMIKKLHELKML